MIRVGRIVKNKKPKYPGFKSILVLTKSSPYGELGPYVLTDEEGQIMENIWQFSKVYKKVPKSKQLYAPPYHNEVTWEWDEEIHTNEQNYVNDKYWKWRKAGMKNKYPVRYPVGFKHRGECIFCLWPTGVVFENGDIEYEELNYVQAREKIYTPVYTELVKKEPKFDKLKDMLEKGINLLIIEVDGPHQESLDYYIENYGVDENFIEDDTILVTKENMDIMLKDTKHSYGHGYVLARALLNI